MLYTRKGDGGDTAFFDSKDRFSKGSLRTELLGSLDELNSLLGVCKAKSTGIILVEKPLPDTILEVQENLFTIQAIVAGAPKELDEKKIEVMEATIDAIEKELPPIKTFLIPGGTEVSALFDYARAVSRRVERCAVRYGEDAELSRPVRQYLNRLSSLLYAIVRFVNKIADAKEIPPSYS